MNQIYNVINDTAVELFRGILSAERSALIEGEYSDITVNDLHIIEVIGIKERKNMSSIAKRLSVTVGSLTTAMNGLVRKGYVVRERSEEDRRVVFIQLTEKGKKAYEHHAGYHEEVLNKVMGTLSAEETQAIAGALVKLKEALLPE